VAARGAPDAGTRNLARGRTVRRRREPGGEEPATPKAALLYKRPSTWTRAFTRRAWVSATACISSTARRGPGGNTSSRTRPTPPIRACAITSRTVLLDLKRTGGGRAPLRPRGGAVRGGATARPAGGGPGEGCRVPVDPAEGGGQRRARPRRCAVHPGPGPRGERQARTGHPRVEAAVDAAPHGLRRPGEAPLEIALSFQALSMPPEARRNLDSASARPATPTSARRSRRPSRSSPLPAVLVL